MIKYASNAYLAARLTFVNTLPMFARLSAPTSSTLSRVWGWIIGSALISFNRAWMRRLMFPQGHSGPDRRSPGRRL